VVFIVERLFLRIISSAMEEVIVINATIGIASDALKRPTPNETSEAKPI
jgi:hypothetical protein